MIRFQRIGRVNDPAFRIVVLEKERAAKAGNIVEQVGTYNPRSKALTLDKERVLYWLGVGAQATGSVHNLLISQGVIQGTKINVLPKKTPPTIESPAPAETPSAPTEQEVVADAEPAPAETPAPEPAPAETPAPTEPTA